MTAERLSGSLWRLELPSSTMPPFATTNTYLLASNGVGAVIDPGFRDRESLAELERALTDAGVRLLKAVLLTHTHGDHRDGLPLLDARFGSPPVYLHPLELPRLGGRAATALGDGRSLTIGGTLVTALHSPGHSPGHLCFHLPEERALLAGDLLAGEGSVWVGVPEGDVGAYLESLERMAALPDLRLVGPGHGPVVDEPYARIAWARRHRLEREGQVVAALARPATLAELRRRVYPDLHPGLERAAETSLLAHLRKLMGEMKVAHAGDGPEGPYLARP